MSLLDLRYRHGHLSYPARRMTAPEWVLPDYIEEANTLLESIEEQLQPRIEEPELSEGFQKLRWFILPTEAWEQLSPECAKP